MLCKKYLSYTGPDFPKIYSLYSNVKYKKDIIKFNQDCFTVHSDLIGGLLKNTQRVNPGDIYAEISNYCSEVDPTDEGCKKPKKLMGVRFLKKEAEL